MQAKDAVRDRPVVAARAPRRAAARRRAPGPAARRAARLPLRAQPARAAGSTPTSSASADRAAGQRGRAGADARPARRSPRNHVVDGLMLHAEVAGLREAQLPSTLPPPGLAVPGVRGGAARARRRDRRAGRCGGRRDRRTRRCAATSCAPPARWRRSRTARRRRPSSTSRARRAAASASRIACVAAGCTGRRRPPPPAGRRRRSRRARPRSRGSTRGPAGLLPAAGEGALRRRARRRRRRGARPAPNCALTDLALTPLDVSTWRRLAPGAPTPELDDAGAASGARASEEAARAGAAAAGQSRRRAGWAADEFSLREALEVAARARQCLSGARAARPARPGRAQCRRPTARWRAADLEKRATAAENALDRGGRQARRAGRHARHARCVATCARRCCAAALRLQRCGAGGAAGRRRCRSRRADRAGARAGRPRRRGAWPRSPRSAAPTGADNLQRAAAASAAAADVFGADFLALPPFTARNGGGACRVARRHRVAARRRCAGGVSVVPAHGAGARAGGAPVGRAARGRKHRRPRHGPRLSVAQLPHVAGERWVGLPLPAGADTAGRQALARGAGADDAGSGASRWSGCGRRLGRGGAARARDHRHRVPVQRARRLRAAGHAAGGAARPVEAWTPWTLHRLLLETLELAHAARGRCGSARHRAFVEPDRRGAEAASARSAHFLPALYFAVNADGDARRARSSSSLDLRSSMPRHGRLRSITSWVRLEPRCRDATMREGMRARSTIRCGCWRGSGRSASSRARTPARRCWRAGAATARAMTRYTPACAVPGQPVRPQRYDAATMPLEALVERAARAQRPVRRHQFDATGGRERAALPAPARCAADVAQLSRRLPRALRACKAPSDGERPALDAETLAYWDLMAGRAPDGRLLRRGLARGADGTARAAARRARGGRRRPRRSRTPPSTPGSRTTTRCSASPQAGADAWQRERLEYAFSVGAGLRRRRDPADRGGVPRRPSRLAQRRRRSGASISAPRSTTPAPSIVRTVMPAPVSFRGAPAQRFWEFEDARIDYGLLPAGPGDLPQLLLSEFATNYGNDWYVIPIDLDGRHADAHALARGHRHLRRADADQAAQRRRRAERRSRCSRCPRCSGRRPRARDGHGLRAVHAGGQPVLPGAEPAAQLDSTPRDEVLFLRDEMANMAWAVERLMQGRVEQRVDLRRGCAHRPPAAAERPAAASPVYRLATDVPDELGAAAAAAAGGARRQPAPRARGDAAPRRQQRAAQRARRDPRRPAARSCTTRRCRAKARASCATTSARAGSAADGALARRCARAWAAAKARAGCASTASSREGYQDAGSSR